MKKYLLITSVLFGILFAIHPSSVFAARIYFDGPSTTISAGDTVIIHVKIDPQGDDLNTVEGTVILPSPGDAKIKDLSVASSVLSLWPRKPSLTEDSKSITFVGGTPGGFDTDSTLFDIIITPAHAGSLTFSTKDTVAYLNDGKATPAALSSSDLTITVDPLAKGTQPVDAWDKIISSDQTPPQKFSIVMGSDPSLYNGNRFLTFNAVDTESGIDHYEVQEGNFGPVRTGTSYVLQDPNTYERIKVSAIDKANNVRTETYRTPFKFNSTSIVLLIVLILIIIYLTLRWYKRRPLV